jgi:membrane protein YdbS with pleckstrin-like domain
VKASASNHQTVRSAKSTVWRFKGSIEPELLEVRTGFLGHRVLLIPVERVEEILPREKLIILRR